MTKDVFSFGSNFDKFFIGFDEILENYKKAADIYTQTTMQNWPFYNIVKNSENNYTIELALAGFGKHNVDIELNDNTLTVKGGMTVDQIDPVDNPVQYIFKGITDRHFTRNFVLSDKVEVKNAEMINGILRIFLESAVPEKKVKKVEIK